MIQEDAWAAQVRRAQIVVDEIGEGIWPEADIYQVYQRMAVEDVTNLWRPHMTDTEFCVVLTRGLRLHRMQHQRKKCRLIPVEKLSSWRGPGVTRSETPSGQLR